MNNNNFPDIGQKIEIEVSSSLTNDKSKMLLSQIMDNIDNQLFFIATPIHNNMMIPISTGEYIKVKYAKSKIGIFVFKAKVLGKKTVDNISYIKIERVSEVSKIQRRNYYRLEIVLNAQIKAKDDQKKAEQTIPVVTKDISGGGLRVVSKEPLKINSIVEVTMTAKRKPITVEGKVVRCVPYQESDYDIGIDFEEIPESIRTEIISFIFEQQRKMRKKGLI